MEWRVESRRNDFMEKSQCYIGALNGVVLCVDRRREGRISGRFYHGYSNEAVPFVNAEQMLFEMEKFFDDIKFPHPAMDNRLFTEKKQESVIKQERVRIVSDDELLSRHGDFGTFIIRVQHRQNSSWQGSITWTDQNRTTNFRSIWEMVKLIESAVDTVSGPEDRADGVVSWFDDETDNEPDKKADDKMV